jgi:hypothetical protein
MSASRSGESSGFTYPMRMYRTSDTASGIDTWYWSGTPPSTFQWIG